VWIWEANREDWNNLDFDCVAVLHDHTQDVKCVKWHPQREELVSCGYDDTIRFWSEVEDDDWHCSAALQAHQSTVWAVAFNKQDPNVFGTLLSIYRFSW
jgi:WD40 repeat protein